MYTELQTTFNKQRQKSINNAWALYPPHVHTATDTTFNKQRQKSINNAWAVYPPHVHTATEQIANQQTDNKEEIVKFDAAWAVS